MREDRTTSINLPWRERERGIRSLSSDSAWNGVRHVHDLIGKTGDARMGRAGLPGNTSRLGGHRSKWWLSRLALVQLDARTKQEHHVELSQGLHALSLLAIVPSCERHDARKRLKLLETGIGTAW